jgi:hypothetical protein
LEYFFVARQRKDRAQPESDAVVLAEEYSMHGRQPWLLVDPVVS